MSAKKNDEIKVNSLLNIRVANNTSLTQSANILGGTQDPLGVPAHNLYQWSLGSNDYFGDNNLTIQVSTTQNPTVIDYIVPLQGNGIQAIVNALNSLGIGFFQYSGTTLYVSNDFYIYGELIITGNAFTMTWKTDNLSIGSSANNQIKLPLEPTGSYDFTIDWGDGQRSQITSWNQAETTHTYSVIGTYTVKIVGTLVGWRFNDTGDKLKILTISNWGDLRLGNSGNYFQGCANVTMDTIADILNLDTTTTLAYLFYGCTALTTVGKMNDWNTNSIISLERSFSLAFNFNQNLSSWDTSNVENFNSTFYGSLVYNQPLNTWVTSSVSNMAFMFRDAILFNQNLASWDLSNVRDISSMFANAFAFNFSLQTWNLENITDAFSFMTGKTSADFNTQFLADMYTAWSNQNVQIGLEIDFGNIGYNASGQAGRDILTGVFGWIITDGGVV